MYIFFTPAPVLFAPGTGNYANQNAVLFVHAVKQYLCLTLSRNAGCVVPQVFDTAMDIFGRVLVGLRTVLKVRGHFLSLSLSVLPNPHVLKRTLKKKQKEVSVLFTEIAIPILEARPPTTYTQRTSLLHSLQRILSDPSSDGGRVLVEIYLNYDCDPDAGPQENIWERLINSLARVTTLHHEASVGSSHNALSGSRAGSGGLTPAITTASMTNFTKEQVRELYSTSGDYVELKKRGLELMVRGVLRPLVGWCNARMPAVNSSGEEGGVRKSEDVGEEGGKGLGLVSEEDGRRGKVVEDDPTAFENLKHRKQVLLEGVKRFNFKPKKVCSFSVWVFIGFLF